jgi:hypothetical protein
MSAVSAQLVIIGLPGAGKTSFLAALWYLVQHKQVDHRLELKDFKGDMKYLNQIADLWAEFEPLPRTNPNTEQTVSMSLNDTATNNSFMLTTPDLSGETFVAQLVGRQFTASYDEFLRGSSGAMVFVSSVDYRKPSRINIAEPLIEEIGAVPNGDDDNSTSVPWDPEKMPTQVQVVELLQFIADRPYFKSPFRIALIISAWDSLLEEHTTPATWMERELPLLAQFLESNRRLFDYTIYGVSAQGGDYEDVDKLTRMLPSERIMVVGRDAKNEHDLTEPLIWLTR